MFEADLEEAPLTDDWTLSAYDLLPTGPNYSHYMGSLTTPPCTEVYFYFRSRDAETRATLVVVMAISQQRVSCIDKRATTKTVFGR